MSAREPPDKQPTFTIDADANELVIRLPLAVIPPLTKSKTAMTISKSAGFKPIGVKYMGRPIAGVWHFTVPKNVYLGDEDDDT